MTRDTYVKRILRKLKSWLAWPKESVMSDEQTELLTVNSDDSTKAYRGTETSFKAESSDRNDILEWAISVLTPVSDAERDKERSR